MALKWLKLNPRPRLSSYFTRVLNFQYSRTPKFLRRFKSNFHLISGGWYMKAPCPYFTFESTDPGFSPLGALGPQAGVECFAPKSRTWLPGAFWHAITLRMSPRIHLKWVWLAPSRLGIFKKLIRSTISKQAFFFLKTMHFELCNVLNFGNRCKIMGTLPDENLYG